MPTAKTPIVIQWSFVYLRDFNCSKADAIFAWSQWKPLL